MARLIPTHAGKTAGALSGGGVCRAHPHSRGENELKQLQIDWAQGSSPLTRGKPTSSGPGQTELRLIPTHAGKTRTAFSEREDVGAHPHSRGENIQ